MTSKYPGPLGGDEFSVTIQSDGKDHKYLLRGGILQHPDECRLPTEIIGFSIMQWARLETHIDILIFSLRRTDYYPGTKVAEGRPPVRFVDKLDMLKKLFRWHPAISSHLKAIEGVCADATELYRLRNLLAHSVFTALEPPSDIILQPFQIDKDGDAHLGVARLPVERIGEFGRHVDRLNFTLSKISQQVLTPETAQRLRTIPPRNPSFP